MEGQQFHTAREVQSGAVEQWQSPCVENHATDSQHQNITGVATAQPPSANKIVSHADVNIEHVAQRTGALSDALPAGCFHLPQMDEGPAVEDSMDTSDLPSTTASVWPSKDLLGADDQNNSNGMCLPEIHKTQVAEIGSPDFPDSEGNFALNEQPSSDYGLDPQFHILDDQDQEELLLDNTESERPGSCTGMPDNSCEPLQSYSESHHITTIPDPDSSVLDTQSSNSSGDSCHHDDSVVNHTCGVVDLPAGMHDQTVSKIDNHGRGRGLGDSTWPETQDVPHVAHAFNSDHKSSKDDDTILATAHASAISPALDQGMFPNEDVSCEFGGQDTPSVGSMDDYSCSEPQNLAAPELLSTTFAEMASRKQKHDECDDLSSQDSIDDHSHPFAELNPEWDEATEDGRLVAEHAYSEPPENMLTKPPSLIPADLEDSDSDTAKEPLSYELTQGYRILKQIMTEGNKSLTWPFMDAVDPNAEGCTEYYEIIKQPVWLKKGIKLLTFYQILFKC